MIERYLDEFKKLRDEIEAIGSSVDENRGFLSLRLKKARMLAEKAYGSGFSAVELNTVSFDVEYDKYYGDEYDPAPDGYKTLLHFVEIKISDLELSIEEGKEQAEIQGFKVRVRDLSKKNTKLEIEIASIKSEPNHGKEYEDKIRQLQGKLDKRNFWQKYPNLVNGITITSIISAVVGSIMLMGVIYKFGYSNSSINSSLNLKVDIKDLNLELKEANINNENLRLTNDSLLQLTETDSTINGTLTKAENKRSE